MAFQALGLTQAKAADLLHLSGKSRVSEIVRGAQIPGERLVRLAEFEAGLRVRQEQAR